jgi:hypothetical protein
VDEGDDMATIASQALVRILPRTRYDLGELRDGSLRLPVAQHVDVVGFERATLQVRVHAGTLPAGSSLQVLLADDGFDPDDPATVPLQTSTVDGGDIGALTIPEGTMFPFYQSVSTVVPGVLGRFLAVVLAFTGGAEGGPAVELGLDLVLTGGSVGGKIHQPSTYLGYAAEAVEAFEPVEPIEPLAADDAGSSESFLTGSVVEGLVSRLASTVRDALDVAAPDGGYPRFGNVNVGIADDDRPAGGETRLTTLLSNAIREALARGGFDVAAPDGGYPRFGNVNVGVDDPGSRPDVGEARLATVLSSAIRDALARGGLDMATPDGGYARFGNVNIGVEGHEPERGVGEERLGAVLAETLREALRRGDLDLATAGGGYARFGNVNVGIDGDIRPVDLRSDPGPQQDG